MTIDVILEKLNEIHFKIHAPKEILSEISSEFIFYAPNYRQHPSFKAHVWDGRIRLIKYGNCYLGLLPDVIKICEREGYTYELEGDFDACKKNITPDEFLDFVEGLGLPWEIREHQLKGCAYGINQGRCFLLSAVNSGKSVMAYMLYRFYKVKTLVITSRTNLVKQLSRDFLDYGSKEIPYEITAGVEKHDIDENLVISTYHSLMNLPPEWFHQFECVIMDEAHHGKAKELIRLMESCINAKYRFGMTGTLDDVETNEMVLKGLFGDILTVVTMAELIEKGYSAKTNIEMILLKYPDTVRKELHKEKIGEDKKKINGLKGKEGYIREMDFLCSYDYRNQFIHDLVASLKGNTLILFNRKEKHGHILKKLLTTVPKPLYYIDGSVAVKNREEYIRIIKTETDCNILASYGTFSEGVSIDGIDNLILASPSNSKVRIVQSTGRVQRVSETKKICNIKDIGDDLSWKSKKNHTLKYFKARAEMYGNEQLEFTTEIIDVTGRSKYSSRIEYA